MVKRYFQRKARKFEVPETDVFIKPDQCMFIDQDKEDQHPSIFMNGNIDIRNMNLWIKRKKDDELVINTRDGIRYSRADYSNEAEYETHGP